MSQDNIVLIADPRVLQIPIKDNGELLVSLVNVPKIIMGPQTELMGPSHVKVRKSVAERLQQASQYLPARINFYFEEGHRPLLSVQKRIFEDYYQRLAKTNPNWDKPKLREEASKYIAPPEDTPPHSTGAAFDIGLIREDGEKIDMGTLSIDTPDQNANRNYTYATNITAQQRENRKILITVLTEAGFVNYPTEWWHWSYGDRYWAYHKKQPNALYASIEA